MALLNLAPTDTTTMATMTEVPTAGYARQAVLWTAPTSASPAQTWNAGSVTFGPFTAAMAAPATHCALVTVATGTSGDLLWWWQLDFSRQAAINEALQFPVAQLVMGMT
jgi:hypothetical protein